MSSQDSGYHKIRSLQVTGGFLDGVKLEFDEGLNCIIGGRGTGKTTVLEVIRYALDRMPDPNTDKERHRAVERLVQSNLGGGSVRVVVETRDGTVYTVARGVGETPLITNGEGEPVEINIGKDIVFGVDIYSQNQIEDIANDSFFQLQLIDKFIQRDLDELEREIRETVRDLKTNAISILETRKVVDDLTEATRQLPDIAERIRSLDRGEAGGGELLRKEREHKGLRTRESNVATEVSALYDAGTDGITALQKNLRQRFERVCNVDLTTTPNSELMKSIRDGALATLDDVEHHLSIAIGLLGGAKASLDPLQKEIAARHAVQEKQYREFIDKHEQERAKGIERARLEQRLVDLKAEESKLHAQRAALEDLYRLRQELRAKLSDLRDARYGLRLGVAERLNQQLSPMIRVRVEQFGCTDEYRALLTQSLKGSGLRYGAIVDRAVERLPPAEFAVLIQSEDSETLGRELDLDADRVTRLIIQLKDKPEIFAVETVELRDRPVLELKDGEDYKDSASLSTGQKCTAILPILLMESAHPLLIDQPEDNLDNAFVFETIVPSIAEVRDSRQLIFVTHNPNIPVLGDAARVFCLRSTGRAASIAKAGSVDDAAPQIMTILEGGRAAFEARQKRYGRPLPKIPEAG